MEINLDVDEPYRYSLLLNTVQGDIWYYSLIALSLLALLLMSALISGSEVAFFSLSPQDREECEKNNTRSDKAITQLLQNPKKLLATILIFNNLINVAIVTLSTFASWHALGDGNSESMAMLIVTITSTILIVFFGEVIPKVYANQKSLNFARKTAFFINIFNRFFTFLSVPLMELTNIIERRISKRGYNISVDELHEALEMTTDHNTSEEEKEILKGIVNFGTISVKQIMRSRLDIKAIDYKMNFHELMDKINKSGYSRLPVYKDTIDKIQGILYVKDLLQFIDQDEHFRWQKLLRNVYFVPESKMIDDLLKKFQEKHVHMAIVVDEYGGTSGLITLEDIIEEIVGEINDEFDSEEIDYSQIDEHTFIFEGKTSLNDITKILDVKTDIFDEVKGESESLGGLLLEINEGMPKFGDNISYEKFQFTIESVNSKRIKRVRIEIVA